MMNEWTVDKLTIGQVSSLLNISAKTLRYWDMIDLFKPSEIDKNTGYRYYSSKQFYQLSLIKYLKCLGVPVSEIKRNLYEMDAGLLLPLLQKQIEVNYERIKELEDIEEKFWDICKDIEIALETTERENVCVKYYPEREIIFVKEKITNRLDLERAFRKLEKLLIGNPVLLYSYVFISISKEDLLQRKFCEYNSAFLSAEHYQTMDKNNITILPAGEFVCVEFWGDFIKTEYYYGLALDFIEKNNYIICGDAFRRNVIPSYREQTQEQLVEIQIQVRKGE